MEVRKIEEFKGGWFIGDFEPSTYKTGEVEVGYLRHHKGEKWDRHYHKEAIEINYLIKGHMYLEYYTIAEVKSGRTLKQGDVFIIDANETAKPIFYEDCELIVVKIPSAKGDKYVVE